MENEIIEMPKSELDLLLENTKMQGMLEQEKKNAKPIITVKEQEPKTLLGYMLLAEGQAKSTNQTVEQVVKNWQSKQSRIEGEILLKNMNTTNTSDGGFYLSSVVSNEIIPALQELAVVRKAGATVTGLIQGKLIMRKEGSGAVAYWTGEGSALTQSNITGGQISLTSKRLGTYVVASDRILEHANPQIEADIERDLMYAIAAQEDITFLRGVGSDYSPKGIENLVDDEYSKFDANGTVSLDNTTKDIGKALLKLRQANIPMFKPAMIISPRTEYYLMTVRDSNGNLAFKDEMTMGKVYGVHYFVSNQIPENLGTGSNETKIYVGDMAQAVIGNGMGLNIKVVPGGTYHNGSGSAVSGLITGETVIAAEMETAFGIKYDKAFSIIEAVKWGA